MRAADNRAASTSEPRISAPSVEPSSGSTACSGCGISPNTLPCSLDDARDVADRAVRVLARRVAEHDLPVRLEALDELVVGEPAAVAVLDGDRQRVALGAARGERRVRALDGQRDVAADERERRVRAQRARQQAGLGQDLEAVADPEHEPAVDSANAITARITGEKRAIAPQRR